MAMLGVAVTPTVRPLPRWVQVMHGVLVPVPLRMLGERTTILLVQPGLRGEMDF